MDRMGSFIIVHTADARGLKLDSEQARVHPHQPQCDNASLGALRFTKTAGMITKWCCAVLVMLCRLTVAFPQSYQSILDNRLNPYPGKPRLSFQENGIFKITVFSDLHFGENPWDSWGPVQDSNSTRLMKRVLKDEVPDYAVINGDLITGENTFRENATNLIDQIVAPLNSAKIPFSSSHGNHDNQVNITHFEEIIYERRVAPLSYTRLSPPGVGGKGGFGNYWVPIYEHSSDIAPKIVLWFFDSRGGVSNTSTGIENLPDWVDASVADWIQSETQLMEQAWGPGEKRLALAFVHIPPHYTQDVQQGLDPQKNPGLNEDHLGQGSVQSTFDSSNVEKDTPFWESLNSNVKNLVAIISGHDHGNEWCAREATKDVIFCFNKHSGYGGYGEFEWGFGVRNIVFKLDGDTPTVETWIRLEEGETRARVWLDDQYDR